MFQFYHRCGLKKQDSNTEGDADERRGGIIFGSIVFNSEGTLSFTKGYIYIYINTHRHTPLYSQAPFTNKKAQKKKTQQQTRSTPSIHTVFLKYHFLLKRRLKQITDFRSGAGKVQDNLGRSRHFQMSRKLSKTTKVMSNMSKESTWKILPLTKDEPI